ncbi:phosphotransferase [bacterium]|nr:phosphotransferase [bacterium]
MRPFAELTEEGQVRRLRSVARAALDAYDIEVASVRSVAVETNVTFRVDTAGGESYALRVEGIDRDTPVDTTTETAWLTALAEAGLPVVGVHPTGDGEPFTVAEVDEVPLPRRCVLFDWLPGVLVDDRPPEAYALLGEAAARLHQHGASWIPPPGLQPLSWDGVVYYPNESIVLFDPEHAPVMPLDRAAVFREVIDRVAMEIDRLWSAATPGYLHGDLSPWNAMVHRGKLTVFDFEYVTVGFPVQDIATTLYYGRDLPEYPDRWNAYRRGYERVCAWPIEFEGQVELHMAARSVMFTNYVLRSGGAGGFTPAVFTSRIEEYLRRYLGAFSVPF